MKIRETFRVSEGDEVLGFVMKAMFLLAGVRGADQSEYPGESRK